MKTIHWIIALILTGIIFLSGFFVGERITQFTVPSGKELVDRSFLDSLYNLKPDTVVRDSFIIEERIQVIEKPYLVPYPVEGEVGVYFYSDTTSTDSLWLVINDTIQGHIRHRDIQYKQAIKYTEISVPYPVIVEREIPALPMQSIYIGPQAMGNANMFAPGFEIGYETRSNFSVAGGFLHDGSRRYYTLRGGWRFNF